MCWERCWRSGWGDSPKTGGNVTEAPTNWMTLDIIIFIIIIWIISEYISESEFFVFVFVFVHVFVFVNVFGRTATYLIAMFVSLVVFVLYFCICLCVMSNVCEQGKGFTCLLFPSSCNSPCLPTIVYVSDTGKTTLIFRF